MHIKNKEINNANEHSCPLKLIYIELHSLKSKSAILKERSKFLCSKNRREK